MRQRQRHLAHQANQRRLAIANRPSGPVSDSEEEEEDAEALLYFARSGAPPAANPCTALFDWMASVPADFGAFLVIISDALRGRHPGDTPILLSDGEQ